jgi:hypothetical protein
MIELLLALLQLSHCLQHGGLVRFINLNAAIDHVVVYLLNVDPLTSKHHQNREELLLSLAVGLQFPHALSQSDSLHLKFVTAVAATNLASIDDFLRLWSEKLGVGKDILSLVDFVGFAKGIDTVLCPTAHIFPLLCQ